MAMADKTNLEKARYWAAAIGGFEKRFGEDPHFTKELNLAIISTLKNEFRRVCPEDLAPLRQIEFEQRFFYYNYFKYVKEAKYGTE